MVAYFFMRRARSIIIAFLSSFFLLPFTGNCQDAHEILIKMIEGHSTANYHGTLTTIFINTPFPQVHKSKIVNYGNSHRREEVLGSKENSRVTFDDGKFLWRFFPNKNMVIKEKSRIGTPIAFPIRDNLELLERNYAIRILGEYTIDGREGHKILFQPTKNDRPRQVFWIDEETGIPVKIEKYGPDTKLASVTSFSEITFAPPLKEEIISLKVPPHTNISEVKEKSNLSIEKATTLMGGRVFLPNYLPPGFVLKNVAFRVSDKEKVLQVFYSDGLSALSVFQKRSKPEEDTVVTPFGKVKLRRREAFMHSSGTLNIMSIRSQDLSLTLVGEVFRDEIRKVAESFDAEKAQSPLKVIKTSPEM
jgi:negative regulator of sigma E activity